jgi:hypothetical protein
LATKQGKHLALHSERITGLKILLVVRHFMAPIPVRVAKLFLLFSKTANSSHSMNSISTLKKEEEKTRRNSVVSDYILFHTIIWIRLAFS